MKKVIFALVFGILITFTSCQKDIDVVQSNTSTSSATSPKGKKSDLPSLAYNKQSNCSNSVYVENGMLVFSDGNHFKTVLECLEQEVENHNQAFENQYGHLGDDAVSDIIETTKFNSFLPLVDFESGLPGFKSLRSKVEAQMPAWLNTPDLDMNTYPRNVAVAGQAMRALVNESYQVKIGNQITDFSASGNSNVSLNTVNSCGLAGYESKSVRFDNDSKKLVTNCALLPSLLGAFVGGEVYVYRKKNNGRWERFSTRISSQVVGTLRNANCNFDHNFSGYDDVNNRSSTGPKYRAWFRPGLMANDQDLTLQVDLLNFSVYHYMNVNVWY